MSLLSCENILVKYMQFCFCLFQFYKINDFKDEEYMVGLADVHWVIFQNCFPLAFLMENIQQRVKPTLM